MLEKGKKVGEYVLIEKLGAGGFGDVWKAEKRTVLDANHFALKFFRPKQDGVDFDKIGKELAVWKQLRGLPHIISVIELDRFEDYVYVVSDFADGGSLEKFLNKNGKASTETEAVRIALEILTGLENLHGKNFVHRDLKPDNILIMNGRHCLADFGISREIKTHSKATGTAGTMEYMPPEAFEKTPSVTPQTDIWAVGAILQRLLTGKLPFPQDDQPSLIAAILMSEPDEMPAGVSPNLREIVKKSLQKNREDRFQSASEMREVLRDILKTPQKIVSNQSGSQAGTFFLQDSDKTAKLEIEPTKDWREIEPEKERQRKLEEAQELKEAEELKRLQKVEIQHQKDESLRLEREKQKKQAEEKNKQESSSWKSSMAIAFIVGFTLVFPIILVFLGMFGASVLNSLFRTNSNTSSVSISNSNQSNSIMNAPATNTVSNAANNTADNRPAINANSTNSSVSNTTNTTANQKSNSDNLKTPLTTVNVSMTIREEETDGEIINCSNCKVILQTSKEKFVKMSNKKGVVFFSNVPCGKLVIRVNDTSEEFKREVSCQNPNVNLGEILRFVGE